MPRRINDEIFVAMGKALDFIDPDKLSMTVVLTAMNRFINEADGSQTAFLDGNQPDRLCAPMKAHIEARGGEVRTRAAFKRFNLNEDGSVAGIELRSGEVIEADEYVSALPCDLVKRVVPKAWASMPYFRQIDELEGIPVINIHIWFDRKLKGVDHLCFSRSPLLSVYADMSTCCKEYASDTESMLELVFAPCSPIAGGKVNWIGKSDEEIIDATMAELARLFPTEIGPGAGPDGGAQVKKYAVVKVPRSVYAAIPGRNKYRPSQETPIRNLTMAGDWYVVCAPSRGRRRAGRRQAEKGLTDGRAGAQDEPEVSRIHGGRRARWQARRGGGHRPRARPAHAGRQGGAPGRRGACGGDGGEGARGHHGRLSHRLRGGDVGPPVVRRVCTPA